jgi:hypothetical protein
MPYDKEKAKAKYQKAKERKIEKKYKEKGCTDEEIQKIKIDVKIFEEFKKEAKSLGKKICRECCENMCDKKAMVCSVCEIL